MTVYDLNRRLSLFCDKLSHYKNKIILVKAHMYTDANDSYDREYNNYFEIIGNFIEKSLSPSIVIYWKYRFEQNRMIPDEYSYSDLIDRILNQIQYDNGTT